MGVEVPWDFFHLGLLLVMLMVLITGIVLCVAVAGVCCFHWIDSKQQNTTPTDNKQPRSSQSKHRRENERNERLAELPPSYEVLFPVAPSYVTPPPPPPMEEEVNKSPQFVLYV